MLETLKVRPQTKSDKEYSCLISIPTPFNIVLLFFTPFLLASKNPSRLNEALLRITYAPIMVIVLLLFFIYNLLLFPLCYVKMAFHKLVMIFVYSKSYRESRA